MSDVQVQRDHHQEQPLQQSQPRQAEQQHESVDRDDLFAAFSDDAQREFLPGTTADADDDDGWGQYDF